MRNKYRDLDCTGFIRLRKCVEYQEMLTGTEVKRDGANTGWEYHVLASEN